MAKIQVLNNGEPVSLNLPKELNISEPLTLTSECGNVLLKIEAHLLNQEKLYRNEEWLRENYVNNGLTMAEIGKKFNVSPMTVCTWLEKFNIETRSVGRRS
jgi:hypothetical protein